MDKDETINLQQIKLDIRNSIFRNDEAFNQKEFTPYRNEESQDKIFFRSNEKQSFKDKVEEEKEREEEHRM